MIKIRMYKMYHSCPNFKRRKMKKTIIVWLLLTLPTLLTSPAHAHTELKYVNCILKENNVDVPIKITIDESTQQLTMIRARYSSRVDATFLPDQINWSVTRGLNETVGNYAISRVAPLTISKLAAGFKLSRGFCELVEVPKQLL
jgi:hypothetical protein